MRLAVATALALAFVPSAGAAMCIRWESGESARPGERVAVAFRTLVPLADGTSRPWAVGDYPFRVSVASPAGRVQPLAVRPRAGDPEVWEGSFVATAPGAWQARVAPTSRRRPRRTRGATGGWRSRWRRPRAACPGGRGRSSSGSPWSFSSTR